MDNKEKFTKYANILREWSSRMNLVAPSTLNDIESRHIADSAQLAEYLPFGVNIIDLGSGAGFPAVVLAILGWNVTAIESIGKKTEFLHAVKQELNLSNFNIINDRVENYLKKTTTRHASGSAIIFTARAFAPLIKILDYVAKQRPTRLVLLKGKNIEAEIIEAKKKYKFNYKLYPSKTGDGFIIDITF